MIKALFAAILFCLVALGGIIFYLSEMDETPTAKQREEAALKEMRGPGGLIEGPVRIQEPVEAAD